MTGGGSRERLAARLRRRPAALYGIVDTGLVAPGDLPAFAAGLASRGVEILQLRAKDLPDDRLLDLALACRAELADSGALFVLDDRADVALLAGADGVHLGARDLPPDAARALLGADRIVGVTAHDPAELGAVDPSVADYVGYGAAFATRTRPGSAVCGPEALTAAVAASTLPVVAIGGITPRNVEALRRSGVAAVAVASALVADRTSPGAVEEFLRVLGSW